MSSIIFTISVFILFAASNTEALDDKKINSCIKGVESSPIIIPPVLDRLAQAIKSINPNIKEETLVATIKNDEANFNFNSAEELKSQDEILQVACIDYNEDLRNAFEVFGKNCEVDLERFVEQSKDKYTPVVKEHDKFDKMYALALACEHV